MAKKEDKNENKKGKGEEEKDDHFRLHISGEAKRNVTAVFLFALAIIFVLGFFDKAGLLGKYLNKGTGFVFGWGKWLSPLVMITIGVILLFRKSALFYISKILGIFVAFLSFLGFFHIYLDERNLLQVAKDGEGGGYLGYLISATLLKLTGTLAGSVILFAFFLIGIIVAFNFSIVTFFQKLGKFRKPKKEFVGADAAEELLQREIIAEEPKAKEEKPAEEVVDEKGNIRSLEFVEGPDKENEKGAMPEKSRSFLGRRKKDSEFSNKLIGQHWTLPPLDLVESTTDKAVGGDVERNAQIIIKTLGHFGIEVELGDIQTGPTVTQFSFRPAVGVKLSRITALNNDLALALAKHPIRIEAPIPGKSLIGIEVPNASPAVVRLRDMLTSKNFLERKTNLNLSLGVDVGGVHMFGNLEKMPHLMVAGSTGSGKSVCINAILMSLFYQNSPDDLKLILVDPKRVELSLYNKIPYLLTDVIVENKKVIGALKWAISEMERRYRLLQDTGSRDISSFNQKVSGGQKRNFTDPETGEVKEEELKKLPFIVIIIDELADLMASYGKEVEGAIIRLAQMARAVGIHLIVSTQRPSVEVLTGLIKANISTRVALRVATQIDSRTILDTSGAEKLIGDGDMLYVSSESTKPKRIQGVYVSEAEVKKVVKFILDQASKNRKNSVEELGEDIIQKEVNVEFAENSAKEKLMSDGKIDLDSYAASGDDDDMLGEAKNLVMQTGKASVSFLQRRLRLGYSRAARIMDMLEEKGVVGPQDGAKQREVLVGQPSSSAPAQPEYEKPEDDQQVRDKWQM